MQPSVHVHVHAEVGVCACRYECELGEGGGGGHRGKSIQRPSITRCDTPFEAYSDRFWRHGTTLG